MSLPCVRCLRNLRWLKLSSSSPTTLHPSLLRPTSTASLHCLSRPSNQLNNLLQPPQQQHKFAQFPPAPGNNPNMDYVYSAQRWLSEATAPPPEEQPPPGLVAKFKWYGKKYWYVVVPVHCVTSAVWYGSFFYLAYSGMDMTSLAQAMHLPESAVLAVQKVPPSAGYAATAYVLYKVFTPLRYMVTISGTVFTIRGLRHWGVLPTAQQVRAEAKEYAKDKREDLTDFVHHKKEDISEYVHHRREDFQEIVKDRKKRLEKRRKSQ